MTARLSGNCAPPSSRARSWGFTLIELLAVIVVITILAGMVLPALANGRTRGRAAFCLSNLRQMARAWLLYADDNSGRLTGNLDGGDAQKPANTNRTWCAGWLDFDNAWDNTNSLLLENSQLARYMSGSVSAYRCPADTSVSRNGGQVRPRVRSVSMNSYMGERTNPYTPGYRQFRNLSDLHAPSPSVAWVFMDERDTSINDGSFAVDMAGYDPRATGSLIIVDFPASSHHRAGGISFADGHQELRTWRDARTTPTVKHPIQLPSGNSPGNQDVEWLQERSSSKILNPTRP